MIEVKGLAKRFRLPKRAASTSDTTARDVREQDGWFHAVRDVSFSCAPGEVLGLLGPNGAGKTTTLRLLSTALTPDAGSIHAHGVDLLEIQGVLGNQARQVEQPERGAKKARRFAAVHACLHHRQHFVFYFRS